MKIKIITVLLVISFLIFYWLKPYYLFAKKTLNISIIKTLLSKDALKIYDNQINILILGIPGEPNDGPYLSDTNIVANYNLNTNKITMFSIPRDIWSDTLQDKINSAYAYGFVKNNNPTDGIKLAKAEISSVIGQPIQYAVVINFNKFEQLVDFVGGIDVDVETSFIDKKFPIIGRENDNCGEDDPEYKCRYETVHFEKGLTKMDGATTLKFVRSRQAQGSEGSDFARENRQQKVIIALEEKIIKMLQKPDIKKIQELYEKLNKLVNRDITNQQAVIIGKNIVFKKLFSNKKLTQSQIVLPEKMFINPPYYEYEGKYVLIPKNNDYSKIHLFIKDQLEKEGKEN